MDTGSQYPVNSLFPDKGLKVTHCSERSRSFEEHQGNDDGWQTISVTLSGGAPWGFTLRGGLEHAEPLLITKVEEGSKAASARLQAGDELLNINSIPLSGFRQEAICLVKGSHKTLSLVVKRKMKMVDIVAQKMPSESDVHMARSFLTKILRSSMRRNEPVSRPHSWHATKFNESHTETKAQSAPSPVWQTRYDASSSSSDFSTEWDQTNLHRGSDHFSSLGSMDSLEHCSHPYPAGRLSPSKSNNNSIEHLGCGKRDSAYSSFSTSSGTPDYTLSKSNTTSTENMVYKINQWDSGGRHSNGRHTHNLNEAVRQDDSIGCLQHSLNTSSHEIPRNEDQAGTRHSSSGRVGIGPVWHVPDIKKSIISPTPPPTPPTRSDSFAATKVHEKGFSTGISEVHGAHAQLKPQTKGLQKMNETYETKTSLETQPNYHPPSTIEPSHVYMSSEAHHHYPHSVSPSTAYSQSTTEVRDRYSFHASGLSNPRLCGDEATFHAQTRTVPVLKPPFSGYFSSMQELPTNNQTHLFKQSQDRRPAASLSGFTADPEGSIQSCYYAVTSHCTPQGITQASLVRVDDSKAFPIANISHNGRERMSVGSQGASKEKYLPPQSQPNDPEKTIDNHSHIYTAPGIPLNGPNFTANKLCELRGNLKLDPISNFDMHSISYPLTKHPDHKRAAGHHTPKEFLQPTNVIKSEAKLCPQKTPMLYSLAQEHCDVGLVPDELNSGSSQQEALDIQNGKHARRSDRFATTLRNEIQMRRAQLQKSRSAAALGSPVEIIEEAIPQKSTESSSPSADCCFSSSYKDHLKEAQARVLQATSFRRKDLEPVLFDHLGSEVVSRKDIPPFLSISEVPSTSGSNQVLRIGGRKRFSTEKKVLSVSEPDKINEMGSDKYLSIPDNVTLLEKNQKVFEATRKPTFPKPMAKPNLHISEENRLSKPRLQCLPNTDTAGLNKSGPATIKKHFNDGSDYSHSANQDDMLEHQRLGTFAEYEAKWNNQKTLEQKGSGKYHSADNILDTGNEDLNQPSCRHERSRSSPSADFYGQKLPVQEMKSAVYSDPVRYWPEQEKENIRLNEHGYCEKTEPQHPALTEDLKKPSSHSKPTLQTSDYSVCSEPSTIIKPKIPVLLPNVEQSPEESSPPPLGKPLEIHLGSGAAAGTALCTINSQTSAPVSRKGTAHKEEPFSEEELQQELVPPPFPPPPPPAALPTTGPNQTTMEGQRSPSPQFAPQRLTDKPPVSMSIQDEAPERIDEIKEENTHVKKVPIKIVHSETSSEKESRQFLNLPTDSVLSSHGPGVTPLQSLGNPDQSYSLFCTYTRQKDLESEPRESLMGPLNDQELQSTANAETNAIHGLQISTSLDQSNEVSAHDDEKQEKLVRDIMDKDKSLVDILDQNKLKTTMDMMEGLFPQGDQLLEEAQQRRKASNKLVGPRTTIEKKEDDSMVAATALVTNSTYYSTSAPKAELLIKMKDMQELSVEDNSEEELEEDNEKELASKKQELISSLSRKLQVLREAQESLQEDVQDNNALGEDVEAIVQDVCKPNELEKFRMFVGDLDKVVNLLLSLSGRLARVENALNSLEEDVSLDEKRTLTDKRKLLIRQHEDAKELKENLDRRERVVYDILASYLPEESMADYEHFVKMKSALIIEQRKLEDKIKLGEEQLKCLMDSLPVDQMTNN